MSPAFSPCVTLRDNIEQPEAVEVGANTIAVTDPNVMLSRAWRILARGRPGTNPSKDGKAILGRCS